MLTKANQSSQHQLDAKVRALLSPTVKQYKSVVLQYLKLAHLACYI